MGHPAGLRAGTRYAFSRNFREKGMIRLSTYLRQFKYVAHREDALETRNDD
jgi:large subunit ribosomal protein L21e